MNAVVDLQAHRREFLRTMANSQFERTEDGRILFPRQGLFIGGAWISEVNGRDRSIDPNIIPNEGLDHLLDVVLAAGSQLTTWFVAPFAGNVTPSATYTAANFDTNATEFINYDEAARQAWTAGAVASQSVDNSASKAVFTMSASGGTIYGAGLLSASAKQAATGKLFAATKFASSRTLSEADTLSIQYTLSASSA